jgi:hypothetical protein
MFQFYASEEFGNLKGKANQKGNRSWVIRPIGYDSVNFATGEFHFQQRQRRAVCPDLHITSPYQ